MKIVRCAFVLLPLFSAGCSEQSNETIMPEVSATPIVRESVEEEPPAFHFKSGDLVLGDFDPNTIGDNLFDPCAEITEEEFAAADLVKGEGFKSPNSENYACPIIDQEELVTIGFVTTPASSRILAERSGGFRNINSAVIPNTYAVEPGGFSGDCFVAVDTIRGSFGASVSSVDPTVELDSLCRVALGKLESLYRLGK